MVFDYSILSIPTWTKGSVHEKVNLKRGLNEILFDRLWYPLSILLLAAIGAKLIGPHGGLQVDKKVCDVTGNGPPWGLTQEWDR